MSLLSAFDLLGPPYSITFQGQETLKTKLGSFLSLVLLSGIVFSSVIFIRDYLDTSNLTVTSSEEDLDKKYAFNIPENGMLPIFFIHSYNGNTLLLAETVFDRFSFFLSTTAVDSDDTERLTFDNTLNMGVPCKDLEQDDTLFNYVAKASNYEEIKEKVHKYGICFRLDETDQIFVRGYGNEKNDRKVSIRAGPCVGRADCRWEEYFNFELHTIFPTIVTNLYNKEKPYDIKINLDDYIRTWSWQSYKMYTIKASLRMVSDAPRIYGGAEEVARFAHVIEKKDSTYFRYSDYDGVVFSECATDDQLILDACQGFLKMDYIFFPLVTIYTRNLPRVTDLLSEIGGISSLLFTTFVYLNSIYLFFTRNTIMTNRLFPLLKYLAKSKGKKQLKLIETEATKVFESSFDFHVLFQEICCLKLLTKVMLSEDQQKAASLLPLYEQLRLDSLAKATQPKIILKKTQSFNQNLKMPEAVVSSIANFSNFIKRMNHPNMDSNGRIESEGSPLNHKPPTISFESIKQQMDQMILDSINGIGLEIPKEIALRQNRAGGYSEILNQADSDSHRPQLKQSRDTLIIKEECKLQSVGFELNLLTQNS